MNQFPRKTPSSDWPLDRTKAETGKPGSPAALADRHFEVARSLFRESNDGLFLFNPNDHRVIDINPVALRLTGFNRRDMLGMQVWDLFQADDPTLLEQMIEAYRVSWFYHSREGFSLRRAQGNPIAVNLSVSRIHTEPTATGLVVARDISDRYDSKIGLDSFFSLTTELMAVIKITDNSPIIQHVSASWEQQFGHPQDHFSGRQVLELAHPDDHMKVLRGFRDLRSSSESLTLAFRIQGHGGRYSWIAWKARAAGELIHLVGRDIAESNRLRDLQDAVKRAEAASRAKSEILADLGHELRNPAAAILEYAEKLVRDEKSNQSVTDRLTDLRILRRNARYMLRLLSDLLDLARIESGTLRVDFTNCAVGEALTEVVDLLNVQAEARGLELSLGFRNAIPETIWTDSTRLRQILINLIGNALKFTPRGSVRVETWLDQSKPDAPELSIEVADTGVGMPPEAIGRLFTPFYRVGGSSTSGAGLGLVISSKLATLLGGRISVWSKPGLGSRFTLTLPTGSLDRVDWLDQPPDSSEDQESCEITVIEPSTAPGFTTTQGEPPRILIADDNGDLLNAVRRRLQRAGLIVYAVNNGHEAIKAAQQAAEQETPFDIILLDREMPFLGGIETGSKLRSMGVKAPLIILSATEEEDLPTHLFEDQVLKPIDWTELKRVFKRVAPPGLDVAWFQRLQ